MINEHETIEIRVIPSLDLVGLDSESFHKKIYEVLIEEKIPREEVVEDSLEKARAHLPCDPAPRRCEWAPSSSYGDELQQQ